MKLIRVEAFNWRNFPEVAFDVPTRLFVIGPNASGKSNLLDLVKFFRDISIPDGGLQYAIRVRGGYSKILSLFARNKNHGKPSLKATLEDDSGVWEYELTLCCEPNGLHRPLVSKEIVKRNGETLLCRPDSNDNIDKQLLTQTHLEQIAVNKSFRPVADFFAKTRYFHPVPQIMRDANMASLLNNAAYGGSFISTMKSTPSRTRESRLKKIIEALKDVLPYFDKLEITVDDAGKPHLQAGYKNWRPHPALQIESDFSDGTLRIIGLLWSLLDAPAESVLLLEEPELSLNQGIIWHLPTIFSSTLRKVKRQVIVTTHSPDILDDEGVLPEEVLILTVGDNGTEAKLLSEYCQSDAGISAQVQQEIPFSQIVQSMIFPRTYQRFLAVGS